MIEALPFEAARVVKVPMKTCQSLLHHGDQRGSPSAQAPAIRSSIPTVWGKSSVQMATVFWKSALNVHRMDGDGDMGGAQPAVANHHIQGITSDSGARTMDNPKATGALGVIHIVMIQ